MARTKRKNLAAITIQPDQCEQQAAAQLSDEQDENVEVRKQRVLIVIPSLLQPSNNKKCKQTSSQPEPPVAAALPKIKSLPAPQPRSLPVPGSTKKYLQQEQQYLVPAPSKPQQLLKLLVASRDAKVDSFKKKLQTIGGLGLWLRSQGLGQFARIFQEQQIDEADLLKLTMQALKDIGVAPVGPRRKLIWAIDQLCNG